MRVIDILSSKLGLSNEEYSKIDQWIKTLDVDNRTVSSLSNSTGGGGRAISEGNVDISLVDGVTLRNPKSNARTIYLDPDGDAWFGSNTENPESTALSIFSNAQTYNGEAVGVGDLLVGDNTSGKANLFWDASAGTLNFRSGTTVGGSIGSGGIDFVLGSIGGWNFNATTLYDDNSTIVLDSANQKITVGSGSPNIVIDGANGLVKSSNYVTRNAGWQIKTDGSAEFQDVFLRGSLQAVSFEKLNVNAVGGIVRAVKGSGLLTADFTTPASTGNPIVGGITIADNNDGSAIAEVDDVLYVYYFDGSYFSYMWATVTAVGSSSGGSRVYSADYEGGSYSHTFPTGEVCSNLGGAGGVGGYTDIEGGATPRVAVYSHTGTPWAGGGETVRFVGGNLNGYYGVSNDYFGIGIGDFSGGNYLTYNADNAGTFMLTTGDGSVQLSDAGIKLYEDDTAGTSRIRWWYNDSGTERIVGGAYGEYSTAGSGHVTMNVYAGKWASYPWAYGQVSIWAYDNDTGKIAKIVVGYADGAQIFSEAQGDHIMQAYGTITLRSLSGANSSNIYIAPADTITIESDTVVHLSNKGMYIGSTGAGGVADGQIEMTSAILSTGGGFRAEGNGYSANRADGGIEVTWESTYGRVLAYGRGPTTSGDQQLQLRGSSILLNEAGSTIVTVNNADIFSAPLTSYSSSISGWSSLTYNQVVYKTLGKTVHVWFYIGGTSNSTGATFTVPYTNNSTIICQSTARVLDNGTPAIGFVNLPVSSSTVTCYRTPNASTTWTSSGTKYVIGYICYQAV